MHIIDRMFPHPCDKKGICLVKASCRLVSHMPWNRKKKCPTYDKWDKRYTLAINIQDNIIVGTAWAILITVVLAILGIFGLGIWKLWELIF